MRKRVILWGLMFAMMIVAAGCGNKTGKEEIIIPEADAKEVDSADMITEYENRLESWQYF